MVVSRMRVVGASNGFRWAIRGCLGLVLKSAMVGSIRITPCYSGERPGSKGDGSAKKAQYIEEECIGRQDVDHPVSLVGRRSASKKFSGRRSQGTQTVGDTECSHPQGSNGGCIFGKAFRTFPQQLSSGQGGREENLY